MLHVHVGVFSKSLASNYRSSGIIHRQKFSSLIQIDKNKKHEIFLLTNNLVDKIFRPVACSHVFFLEHGKVVIAGVLQAKETSRPWWSTVLSQWSLVQ